jgi:16S rRNA (cytosine967-C5)-methyltransferase
MSEMPRKIEASRQAETLRQSKAPRQNGARRKARESLEAQASPESGTSRQTEATPKHETAHKTSLGRAAAERSEGDAARQSSTRNAAQSSKVSRSAKNSKSAKIRENAKMAASPNSAAAARTQARQVALRALSQIEAVDTPLPALLDSQKLEGATRSFARELATGTIRQRARLDWTIEPLLKKSLSSLDAPVRNALRLAAYERLVLDTPHAVVADEYAGLMRGEKLKSAVAFVNAVARRLPDVWRASPDEKREPARHLAIEYSHPQWLVERWLKRLGFDDCRALCRANNEIAPLCLRANTQRTSRHRVLESLRARGLEAFEGELSPHAIVLEGTPGSPELWPEWARGEIIAQDEAAQLVAFVVAPHEGDFVIDAASAPGGKTTHIAQLMNDKGHVLACDKSEGRLKLVRQNAARLGLNCIETQTADLLELRDDQPQPIEPQPLESPLSKLSVNELQSRESNSDEPNFRESSLRNSPLPASSLGERHLSESSTRLTCDALLLDAPCSGTGTLRRRPDAKWRKSAVQLRELVVLQRELLDAAALLVRVGGVLVYSTCSLEPEENEEQASAFLARHANWQLDVAHSVGHNIDPAIAHLRHDDGFWRTSPADVIADVVEDAIEYSNPAESASSSHRHPDGSHTRPDGMFAARFCRIE